MLPHLNSARVPFQSPLKNDWIATGSPKSLDPEDFAQADYVTVRLEQPRAEDALLAAGMAIAKGKPTVLMAPERKQLPWFLQQADLSYPGQIFVAEGNAAPGAEQLANLQGVEVKDERKLDTFIGCLMSGLTEDQYAEGRSHLMAINDTLSEKLGRNNNYCEGISVGSVGTFGTPKESLVVDLEAVKGAESCVFYQYDDASRPSGMWVELGAALAWGKPCTLFTPNLNGVPDGIKKGLSNLKVVQYGSHENMKEILSNSPETLRSFGA